MKALSTSLLFSIIVSASCFAQNIYLIGNVRNDDVVKIKHLIATIDGSLEPKKIQLFEESTLIYTYKKNNTDNSPLSNKELDAIMNHLVRAHASFPSRIPSENDIIKVKGNIRLPESNIITFDKNDAELPPLSFNDFSALLEYLRESKKITYKFAVLLVLSKDKPIVKIDFPKDDQSVDTKIIEGSANGIDSISSIFVKLNNGDWKKADGTSNWKIELPIPKEKSSISAIAIDYYNDTSLVETVSNIYFKEKIPLAIDFMYPNQSRNVVPKCMRAGGEHSYRFKISADSAIDINKLRIVVEDSDGAEKGQCRISSLPEDAKIKMPSSNDYCFVTRHTITGSLNICSINAEEDYYYRIEYNGTENVTVPAKIKIHFTSFSLTEEYEPCNCE